MIGVVISIIALGVFLILRAFKEGVQFFYTPQEFMQAENLNHKTIQLGGYVKRHSHQVQSHGLTHSFILTDRTCEIPIIYKGILPTLFKEGQAVVIQGQWDNSSFDAHKIFAKHDEIYRPRKRDTMDNDPILLKGI